MRRSLYREYRPQTFDELVGQAHIARTLKNAVETATVAHAYVFAGPRGTGKTSTARILAKALNCTGTPDAPKTQPTAHPCGVCEHCRAIADSVSLDVIEMDAASNRSIDDIRELRDRVAYAPVEGRFKVYIIDEVHMLTREAFNALLKTLEEPPGNVVFVLATTEPHKIPETIVSRCQRFDFRRPQVHDIARLLARIVESENQRSDDDRGAPPVEIQEAALLEIARHSQGGFRDAIGTLEKLISYGEGTIHPGDVLEALGVTKTDLLFEVTDICLERRTGEALQFVQRLANEGVDYPQFIRDLLRHLRQVFLLQHLGDAAEDEAALRALGQTVELDDELVRRLLPQTHQIHPRELVGMIETLGQAQRDIKDGLDARLQLELALVKITRPQVDASAAGLEERLRRLESGLGATRYACETAGAKAEAADAKAESVAQTASAGGAPLTPAAEPAAAARRGGAPVAEKPPAASTAEAASTPAAAAPVAAPDAGPALTLERVKRAWELVLQRVQTVNVGLYASLRDARPTALAGERLTVTMPSNFALTRAAEAGNDEVLAAAVAETLGRRLQAEFVLGDQSGDAPAPPATPAQAPLDYTQTISLTKQMLDAEELEEP
jgi:DNA polymerase-3 subunit gamma/tau